MLLGAATEFPRNAPGSDRPRDPFTRAFLADMLSERATVHEEAITMANLNAAFTLAFVGFMRMGEFTWPNEELARTPEAFAQRHVT